MFRKFSPIYEGFYFSRNLTGGRRNKYKFIRVSLFKFKDHRISSCKRVNRSVIKLKRVFILTGRRYRLAACAKNKLKINNLPR